MTSVSAKIAVEVKAPPTLKFSANGVSVIDTAGTVTLTVQHTGSTLGPVSVSYATADGTAKAGTDYVATNGTLSWAAGDGADKTITVGIIARAGNQADRKFTVTLASPSGATLVATLTQTITMQK